MSKNRLLITILTLTLLLITNFVFANGLIVNESGNVGIGTEAPQAALHVEGATIIGSGRGTTTFNVASAHFSDYSTDFIHIKLPFNTLVASDMFHVKVRGYEFHPSPGKIIDLTYAGYCYRGNNSIIRTSVLDPTDYFNPAIYEGSDGYVYLRFQPQDTYHLSFAVDSMYVGNGRIIEPGEVEIIRSASETL